MGDWGGLILDILFMIAERIEVVEDFVSFSSVCTTWRAAALRKGAARSLRPVQSLMLQSRFNDLTANEIYNFARNKICKFSLPNGTLEKKFYTNGWILTYGAVVNLINPFSGHVISLPPKRAFGSQIYYNITKAALSSNPSFFPHNYTLMVILVHFYKLYSLGFWKPGDREWTVLQTDINNEFQDIIYCKGQFYTVDQLGVIYVCHIRGSNPTVVAVSSPLSLYSPLATIHLAAKTDNHSLLLIVDKFYCGNSKFMVYELDLIGKGLKEVNDLGAKTIFVGNYQESVCVEHSKFPLGIIVADDIDFHDFHCLERGCRNGCPVTERLHKSGMSMGIYNLSGKEVQNFIHPL